MIDSTRQTEQSQQIYMLGSTYMYLSLVMYLFSTRPFNVLASRVDSSTAGRVRHRVRSVNLGTDVLRQIEASLQHMRHRVRTRLTVLG